MIVVADASPINYLILIGEIELLPRLYGSVLIPQRVHVELLRPRAPLAVRTWASDLPAWCRVAQLGPTTSELIAELDPGERDAIQLAVDSGIETILMDDQNGRREAVRLNLRVTGTASILENAAAHGWINFREAFGRLLSTNFRLSSEVREDFLRRNP